jgi:hypothetical protein
MFGNKKILERLEQIERDQQIMIHLLESCKTLIFNLNVVRKLGRPKKTRLKKINQQ